MRNIILFVLMFLNGAGVFALTTLLADAPVLLEIKGGWEYRWGDSPLNASQTPVWTSAGSDPWAGKRPRLYTICPDAEILTISGSVPSCRPSFFPIPFYT